MILNGDVQKFEQILTNIAIQYDGTFVFESTKAYFYFNTLDQSYAFIEQIDADWNLNWTRIKIVE